MIRKNGDFGRAHLSYANPRWKGEPKHLKYPEEKKEPILQAGESKWNAHRQDCPEGQPRRVVESLQRESR